MNNRNLCSYKQLLKRCASFPYSLSSLVRVPSFHFPLTDRVTLSLVGLYTCSFRPLTWSLVASDSLDTIVCTIVHVCIPPPHSINHAPSCILVSVIETQYRCCNAKIFLGIHVLEYSHPLLPSSTVTLQTLRLHSNPRSLSPPNTHMHTHTLTPSHPHSHPTAVETQGTSCVRRRNSAPFILPRSPPS